MILLDMFSKSRVVREQVFGTATLDQFQLIGVDLLQIPLILLFHSGTSDGSVGAMQFNVLGGIGNKEFCCRQKIAGTLNSRHRAWYSNKQSEDYLNTSDGKSPLSSLFSELISKKEIVR